jgi:RimJ/RimL family protein N-acetyltransferase
MQLMALPRPNSLRRVREWLSQANQDERRVLLVISSRRGGRALGYTQLAQIETLHRTAELGICLAHEAQGRGLGGQSMRLLEEYAFDALGLRKLTLRVLKGNTKAARLYRRLGYSKVGTLRKQFWQGGKFHDVVLMEKFLTREASA